jgi:hypothetical protein
MSLILASAASMGAFWLATYTHDKGIQRKLEKEKSVKDPRIVRKDVYSQRYQSIEQLAPLIAAGKARIVRETVTTDLQGVPCRWLELATGEAVRTYDMFHPPVAQ